LNEVSCIVDIREPTDFIVKLSNIFDKLGTKKLIDGDIHLKKDDQEIRIERMTINDFFKKLTSDRFDNQVLRMKEYSNYVILVTDTGSIKRKQRNFILKNMVKLSLNKNFTVLLCQNQTDTLKVIEYIAECMIEGTEFKTEEIKHTAIKYEYDNVSMLTGIRGIKYNLSISLLKEFGSISNLCNTNKYVIKNRVKKIGDILAERIYNALHDNYMAEKINEKSNR